MISLNANLLDGSVSQPWNAADLHRKMRLRRDLTQKETTLVENCIKKGFSLVVACQHFAHMEKS